MGSKKIGSKKIYIYVHVTSVFCMLASTSTCVTVVLPTGTCILHMCRVHFLFLCVHLPYKLVLQTHYTVVIRNLYM